MPGLLDRTIFSNLEIMLDKSVAFYDFMTWVDDGRAMNVAYVDFSKAFDLDSKAVSHDILAGKLLKCELDKWTLR